jgi:hypothetical protein
MDAVIGAGDAGGGHQLLQLFLGAALLMAIVATITGRRLADDGAWRPRAIYLSVAMLPVLLVMVVAAALFLEAIVQLILGPESPTIDAVNETIGRLGGTDLGGLTDAIQNLPGGLGALLDRASGAFGAERSDLLARQAVIGALTFLAAGFLYWLHLGWRRALMAEDGFAGSVASRTFQAFAYTTTFVFVVVFLLGAVHAGYGLFRVIAPGFTVGLVTTETADRERGVAEFIAGGGLAIVGYWLATMHWALATRLRNPEPPPTSEAAGATTTEPIAPPPTPPETPS